MCRVVWAGVTLFEMATACALAIISGKIIFIFTFVAPCGALQTHFHGRGRDGDRGICCTRSPAGSCRAATEGPANRRSEKKNALSEAASIFSFRPLPWDYQRRAAPCLQRRRPPPVADTGRSCWGSGLQDASAAQGTKQTQGAATRRIQRVEIAATLPR